MTCDYSVHPYVSDPMDPAPMPNVYRPAPTVTYLDSMGDPYALTAGVCESGTCIIPTRDGNHVAFTSEPNPHGNLRGYATLAETRQFFDEVKAGKWDHVAAGDE